MPKMTGLSGNEIYCLHLKNAHYTQAILHTIHRAAQLLAQHFPPKPHAPPNEPPGTITRN